MVFDINIGVHLGVTIYLPAHSREDTVRWGGETSRETERTVLEECLDVLISIIDGLKLLFGLLGKS
jgi:hypothetical protein